MIRALVMHNKTGFFVDEGRPRGFDYELLTKYEEFLNRGVSRRSIRTEIAFVPLPLEQLGPALLEGKGDLIAAGLTVTPERQKRYAFTKPYLAKVDQIVVAHGDGEGVDTESDLAGRRVYVMRGSSYAEHLRELSARLTREGLSPIHIDEAAEHLQTEDVLELVNAGVVPLTVADRHVAELWASVLPNLTLLERASVARGSSLAWAVRKGSPELLASLDEFIRSNRKGTLLGNILFKRYYENAKFVRNPTAREEREKLERVAGLFQKYAKTYGFDWLMIAAQAYQESGLDHARKSRVGAVGIMQILPSTAADKNVGIPDIRSLENNIHAGTKYLAFLRDRYFSGSELGPNERHFFSMAAYNAGPARVRQFRKRAQSMGLDPDKWFLNVERAALEIVGQETVRYVANIYKYYVAYSLVAESRQRRQTSVVTDH